MLSVTFFKASVLSCSKIITTSFGKDETHVIFGLIIYLGCKAQYLEICCKNLHLITHKKTLCEINMLKLKNN